MSRPRTVELFPGDRVGLLTVLNKAGYTYRHTGQRIQLYLCQCDCGRRKAIRQDQLRRDGGRRIRSCGCWIAGSLGAGLGGSTHGLSDHPLYPGWVMRLQRCENPRNADYKDYGARGVYVCERWRGASGLANYIADVSPRPSPRHELHRVDNDGPYSPENCRWVTPEEHKRLHSGRLVLRVPEGYWERRRAGR